MIMTKVTIKAEPGEIAVDPARTAIVMIDMQRDFLEPGGFGETLGNDVSLLTKAIAPAKALLAAARRAKMLIVHTREGHRPDMADAHPAKVERGAPSMRIGDPGAMGRILIRGEAGHDIIPELAPEPGEPVIDKPGKGAFYAAAAASSASRSAMASLKDSHANSGGTPSAWAICSQVAPPRSAARIPMSWPSCALREIPSPRARSSSAS